jgi:DNA-directed RNA polymerase specialized sigma24 family protein
LAGLKQEKGVGLLALDDALSSLSAIDPELGRLVELRFFGGLTVRETAVVLGVSPATVKRGFRTAKIWLHRELNGSRS